MPRKRRQLAHLERARLEKPHKRAVLRSGDHVLEYSASDNSSDPDSDIPFWPEEDESDDDLPFQEADKQSLVLKWTPGAKLKARKPYLGTSRFTTWRRKSKMEKRARSMAGSKTIFELWNQDPKANDDEMTENNDNSVKEEMEQAPEININLAIDILENTFHIDATDRRIERGLKVTSKRDFLRLLCVHRYLTALLEKNPRKKTSEEIAACFYPTKNKEWSGRQIRIWSERFLQDHRLPDKNQGSHIKIKSIIADENTRSVCFAWLRSKKAHMISGKTFAEWINLHLHLEIGLPASVEISERTATRWLHALNFNVGDVSKQGTYIDGHERVDVVDYRKKFLERMDDYQKRMPIYTGDTMETRIVPELANDTKPLILVVHDESCFQSNDSGKTGWFDEDHRLIRPKGSGKSLMVSAFLCECHGLLRLSEDQMDHHPVEMHDSTQIIRPGSNNEGYWTNENLVNQTKKAMSIFKILHPNCDPLFVFDNSANHHASAADALVASRLNVSDGGKNRQVIMREGWFMNENGEIVGQDFNANGQQKGLKKILQERFLWREGTGLCMYCRTENNSSTGLKRADAVELLSKQPDFAAQKEWLTETIICEPGFLIDFFPKFHCEFNFIEMYWGAVKRYTRAHCDYSFKKLDNILKNALSSVSVTHIRRFARKCFRLLGCLFLQCI